MSQALRSVLRTSPLLHVRPSSSQPLRRGVASSAAVREEGSSSSGQVTSPAQVSSSQGRDLVREQEERTLRPIEAETVSDAPPELRQRTVRIFKPAKTANSSGRAGTAFWRVDFDILQGSARWQNPLMGWDSSADYMQGVGLKFKSKEDAILFCEKQGWPYFIQEPHKARIPPKSYAANYSYSPGKLRIHHTK